MPSTTRQWILNSKPDYLPTLKGPSPTFKLVTSDLPSLSPTQVLVKTLIISNDPAQRSWIGRTADPARLYVPPISEGEVMASFAVGEVVESGSPSNIPVGSLVTVPTGWVEYSIHEIPWLKDVPPIQSLQVIKPIDGLDLAHFLGVFGVPGLTAYYGIKEIARATSKDTVVVSGAAGATGSTVVQIAKNIIGCKRVIGIAGTDEKCRWVEKLGADVCLNYKKDSFEQDLINTTEGFVDVYYDNVGGEILDLMLKRMNRDGRIASCGTISTYNNPDADGIKNYVEVILMRLNIQGFIVIDYLHKAAEAVEELAQAWKEGKIVIDDSTLTIVETGIEGVPDAWLKLFDGGNTGKLCTKIVS